MTADSYTPTSVEDRGDMLYFKDVSSVAKVIPKGSELAGLYLRRLGGAVSAEYEGLKQGVKPSTPTEVTTYETEVELSSYELLTLSTNPKTIIEAPGAGKKITLISVSMFLDYNATAYVDALSSEFVLAYNDTTGAKMVTIPVADFLVNSEDSSLESAVNGIVSGGDNASTWENKKVVAYLTQAIATGDSPVRIKVTYRIDDTGL
jgi:hypothetical protein